MAIIGLGAGLTFDVLTLSRIYGAGTDLRRASGYHPPPPPTAESATEPGQCDAIADPVERYKCSRRLKGK
jgi:hypothetical protein